MATWAGGLAALALRPRYMVDYVDRMFVGMVEDFSGTVPSSVWIPKAPLAIFCIASTSPRIAASRT
ncbi:MAG: hypothetical protein LBU76_02625 [Azoarcus sp.]|nr:hypothetical protein [Azoarcus sp.]